MITIADYLKTIIAGLAFFWGILTFIWYRQLAPEVSVASKGVRVISAAIGIFILFHLLFGITTGYTPIEMAPFTSNEVVWDIILVSLSLLLVWREPIFYLEKRSLDAIKKSFSRRFKIGKGSLKCIDSIDYEILNSIKAYGGVLSKIEKELLKWTDVRDIRRRIAKLGYLGYLDVTKDRIFITSEGLDVLNLPPVVFASRVEDREVLQKMAEIRAYIRRENTAGVISESSKLLEYVLKQEIKKSNRFSQEEFEKKWKPFHKATLGGLIAASREYKIINKFEDNVLSAFNELRKACIHLENGKMRTPKIEEAYFAFTLAEIFIRSHFAPKI